MVTIAELIGLFFLGVGLFFCVVGVIGLLRFPDVYTRIHASGKVSTVGLMGLLIGMAILLPETALKALALLLFMLITTPVASHAIAAAAQRSGVPMVDPARDDLAARATTEETSRQRSVPG